MTTIEINDEELEVDDDEERSIDEINAEMLANFDADEARFINGGGSF